MLLGSGFRDTAPTLTRLLSLLTFPTPSTRSIVLLSCGPSASISRPSLLGWIAATVMRVPSSLVLVMSLCSPFAARGVFSKETPSVRCSLLWLFTQPLQRPA